MRGNAINAEERHEVEVTDEQSTLDSLACSESGKWSVLTRLKLIG